MKNFVCFLMFFVVTLVIFSNVYASIDANTVALWLFNEEQGDKVTDSSKNGHNGVFKGNPKWVKAKYGSGLEFPGDGTAYVVVESSPKLELKELTIEALVKVEKPMAKYQGIICKQQAGCTNRNYGMWAHDTKNVLHAQIGANGDCAYSIDGITVITDNNWHYLAFTFDGQMGRLYVDGTLEAETAYNVPPFFSDDPLYIGAPNANNANGLLGIIDEARISKVARTAGEIKEAMSFGLQKLASVKPGKKLSSTWAALKER